MDKKTLLPLLLLFAAGGAAVYYYTKEDEPKTPPGINPNQPPLYTAQAGGQQVQVWANAAGQLVDTFGNLWGTIKDIKNQKEFEEKAKQLNAAVANNLYGLPIGNAYGTNPMPGNMFLGYDTQYVLVPNEFARQLQVNRGPFLWNGEPADLIAPNWPLVI